MVVEITQASREGAEIVPSGPKHVWIEPTSRCNTRCTHCGHFYFKFGQDIDEPLYERIAAEVLPGTESVELIGYGEPLMAKGFQRMYEACASRGISVLTTTNGILLRNRELTARLVRSPLTLCLSIDGARKETFEAVRPYIGWDGMLKILETVRDEARLAGPEKQFKFRLNFVAMKQNIADLPALVRLAHDYGAQEILVLPLMDEESFEKVTGQSVDSSPELVSPAYLQALREAKRLGVELRVPPAFVSLIVRGATRGPLAPVARLWRRALLLSFYTHTHGLRATLERARGNGRRAGAAAATCSMPWRDAYFAADGKVYACCAMGDPLGDMSKQTWPEIWNGPLFRNMRRTIHSWNPTKICRMCALPAGINGGDAHGYAKLFAGYTSRPIALDAASVRFGEGFFGVERTPEGVTSHVWMSRRGTMDIAVPRDAKFLRLEVVARAPGDEINPGIARMAGQPDEPFDNSCEHIHLPVRTSAGRDTTITIEMDRAWRIEPDEREFGLLVRGLAFLY